MSDDQLVEQIAQRVAVLVADQQPQPLLDAKAAAELLGVPATWVLAEARAERIPHVRLGKYVRFRAGDLMAWMGERSRGPRRSAA